LGALERPLNDAAFAPLSARRRSRFQGPWSTAPALTAPAAGG